MFTRPYRRLPRVSRAFSSRRAIVNTLYLFQYSAAFLNTISLFCRPATVEAKRLKPLTQKIRASFGRRNVLLLWGKRRSGNCGGARGAHPSQHRSLSLARLFRPFFFIFPGLLPLASAWNSLGIPGGELEKRGILTIQRQGRQERGFPRRNVSVVMIGYNEETFDFNGRLHITIGIIIFFFLHRRLTGYSSAIIFFLLRLTQRVAMQMKLRSRQSPTAWRRKKE